MDEEETVEGRKLEKRIKLKSKKSKRTEGGDVIMHEVEDTSGDKEIEHCQASDKDETLKSKKRKSKNKEKKKHKKVEGIDDVDLEKNDSSKSELSVLNGEDSTVDLVTDLERKKKNKEKSKKINRVSGSGVHKMEDMGLDGRIEHSEAFEKDEIFEKEENEKVKGVEDVDLEENYEDGTELIGLNDNDSTRVPVTNVERKKKKDKSKNKNSTDKNTNGKDNIGDAIKNAQHKEKKKVKNTNGDGHDENGKDGIQDGTNANGEDSVGNAISNLEQKKKKNAKINNENEAGDKSNGEDSNGDTINYVEQKKKKKKKRENQSDVGIAEEVEVSKAQESLAEENVPKTNNNEKSEGKMMENRNDTTENVEKKKKKRKRAEENKKARSNKKVRFSSEVEVFNLPPEHSTTENNEEDKDKVYRWNNKGDDLIRGKRFSKEEDEIVKDAVLQYVELHNLGEDGLDMVLNSKKQPEVKGCWKEIATCIPYRPYSSIYGRAQVLFRRASKRKWTEEEFEMIINHQKTHGNKWKDLADELGTHHWHVKDAWRRVRLRNQNKGSWSQQEYQRLFDLVNTDLQLKVSQAEEKNSKYGMLRDNIAWTAISDRVETRNEAVCCMKWYNQLTSPMVSQGVWADADDYYMIGKLYSLDASCIEDVDWDELLESRSGELCRKRWNQMALHMGQNGLKPFSEQVEVLAKRYCPHLFEVREEWDKKPRVV